MLISFRSSLPNPGVLQSWNPSEGACSFSGVSCKGGRVASITLYGVLLGADLGAVADHLMAIPTLEILALRGANLTGTLTAAGGAPAPRCGARLSELDLSGNSLGGSVAGAAALAAACPGLRALNLSGNSLGLDPAAKETPATRYLDLSSNDLAGEVAAGVLGGCRSLAVLNLSDNHFAGKLPPDLSSCYSLTALILSNNNFSGQFPVQTLTSMSNLKTLDLGFNSFNGTLPDPISRLSTLELLDLSSNSFSGSIPSSLCPSPLFSLKELYLQNNLFSAQRLDPPTLAKQSGNIAVGLVTGKRYVYLRNDESSQCHGTGSLLEFGGIRPEDLNRLPSKKLCNFTRVYIGSTQYTFNNNGSMIFLDLSYNQLQGDIPKELGNMYYLMILNLGHNLLSGLIPLDLGNLHHVAVLDLSHNALEGPIPPSFSALSLSEIDLSNNELNGSIPELGSLATFPRYRYENNSGLCGFPLPPCGGNSGLMQATNIKRLIVGLL
uniref:non-specific serine/threonine protein kinase n=1 Tax=Ananas comosus var. bracteatus TaxID=296719 RepID=A0A6V7PSV2_ANACO|nr:unnamed protein product [Ananas comosus var. bracteatus]